MKKIYFLLPNLSAGGAERVSITIARLLKKEGFSVEFINFGYQEGEMIDWVIPEFKLTSFGLSRTLQAIPKLVAFMKGNKEAIFFSSREHVNLISLVSSKLSGAKSIVRIPNMPLNKLSKGISGIKMRIIKELNKFLLNSAQLIIAQNAEMKEQLIHFYKLPDKKIKAINNPVDSEFIKTQAENHSFPFIKGEINFVNVCNIQFSKGIDILIKAWPKVKAVIPNAHMYIIGRDNSDYAQEIKCMAETLPDFSFLGFKSNPYPFLKYSDVFVLPSRMEGFPNVVLEAMSFNKPIASTECIKVLNEIIIQGENGYTCPVENADALAECMIKASYLKPNKTEYSLFQKEELINCFSL